MHSCEYIKVLVEKEENSFLEGPLEKYFYYCKGYLPKEKAEKINKLKRCGKNILKEILCLTRLVNQSQIISGIFQSSNQLKDYISKLIPYSFGIYVKFRLEAPYFSRDENEFYIIQNPILKETNFKVPMVRGSSWKGALAHAFREIINETSGENKPKKSASFFRIFGAGSDAIKAIEQSLKKDNKKEIFVEKLVELILFELGLEIDQELLKKLKELENKNWKGLIEFIQKCVVKSIDSQEGGLPKELKTHRGRAIFYPTYFDRISLEIINPHDRRKRAGKNPIHYEVVPRKTEGVLQLIYIPYDGIVKNENILKEEVKEDLGNLLKAIEKLSQLGIGAKTKLGWGRFEIIEKHICVNGDLEISEGWETCRV